MLRDHVPQALQADPRFHWRGGDISRLESLTDAAFAFALTLLAISGEVPRTFRELQTAMIEFPAFLVCAAVLVMVWFFHYRYHRRFGLEDTPSVLFNMALLVLVLFYVYPLKFMFSMLWRQIRTGSAEVVLDDGTHAAMISRADSQTLMYFYGAGFAAIFLLFGLMYVHAWRRRKVLQLGEVERFMVRVEVGAHLFSSAVGLLAVAIAAAGTHAVPLAGFSFFLLPLGHTILGFVNARRFRRRFGAS
ncbi:MAG: TMEM175 family protein [Acidobacteriota bacterium]|nr:TMEM175 family protein [Acidobacteriota bacterium]